MKTLMTFLKSLLQDKEKIIKSERKKIHDSGISFSVKDNTNVTLDDWLVFYEFYKSTYHERMQAPYLNFDFLIWSTSIKMLFALYFFC